MTFGTDLPSLVDAVAEIPEEFMVRVGMMNPMYMPRIKERLIESYDNDKVFKFLHLPVQSGSDKVLHDMKRGHTAGTFREIVKKARDNEVKVILQVYPGGDNAHIVRKISKQYNVPLVDNEKVFQEKLKSAKIEDYFVADGHCNEKGYGIIADNVYSVLVEHRLLPNN